MTFVPDRQWGDSTPLRSAHQAILRACREHGWGASTILNEDFRKQVLVHAVTGEPVTVDIVYDERSREPEHRPGGGLRLNGSDAASSTKTSESRDSTRPSVTESSIDPEAGTPLPPR